MTFKDVYGEMPLMSASEPSITVSRNGGQYSATEIQNITISADKPFIYGVQRLSIPTSCSTFDLSFMTGPKTGAISFSFADALEASAIVSTLEDELNSLPSHWHRTGGRSLAVSGHLERVDFISRTCQRHCH